MIFIGLTGDGEDQKSEIETFVKDHKIAFPTGYGSKSLDEWGIEFLPTTYVVGGDGKIAWRSDLGEGTLTEAIDKALEAIKKE